MKNALEAGIQLWDVPCIRDSYDEDNNTEEDESSEEEETKEAAVDKMGQMLKNKLTMMKNLKKGFVYFME